VNREGLSVLVWNQRFRGSTARSRGIQNGRLIIDFAAEGVLVPVGTADVIVCTTPPDVEVKVVYVAEDDDDGGVVVVAAGAWPGVDGVTVVVVVACCFDDEQI